MLNIFGSLVLIETIQMENCGEYHPDKKTIYIQKGLKDSDQISTELHEFIHAVFDRTGITNQLSDDLEELICHCLSESMVENYEISRLE